MPEGFFVGGPLDGTTYTLRNESNVLAVDPDQGVAWLYKRLLDQTPGSPNYHPGLPNYALDMTPGETDSATGSRIYDEERSIAAVEAGYDVIAVPGDMPSQEQIDEEEVLIDGE